MKKIKKENIKVGDFIYIEDKEDKERRFVVKIIEVCDERKKDIIDWWGLTSKLFAMSEILIVGQRDFNMDDRSWERFDLFKLNKKEILKFTKLLILKNL